MPVTFTLNQSFVQPPAAVFAALTDLQGTASWLPGIIRIELQTPPPIGKGTIWRETRRVMGREGTEEFLITAYEPPGRLSLSCDGTKGSTGQGLMTFDYDFRPDGAGTALQLHGALGGFNLFGRIMMTLFKGVFVSAMRKDLTALKTFLDSKA